MRDGTTQPVLSEDLWAQVAALKPGTARRGGCSVRREARPKAGANAGLDGGMAGLALTLGGKRKAPDRTDGCLMLEAVPWENPMYGISGGAAGNVAYGGTVNPPRNRKGGAGNPPPTGARASALPDEAM